GLLDEIPTLRMLRLDAETLKARAESLAEGLSRRLNPENSQIRVVEVQDASGGGSCPEIALKGWGVAIRHKTLGAGQIQKLLREVETPILCGARDDEIVIHVRTLQDGEENIVIDSLGDVLNV
ncbi:MAG: L-seryl-tRNA(Sec) selenium transferase, partial [Synergistaceae bacterium]|nr:L-seryl-tRNA(Sec) selenium transferase [Synergistaceae bacterium]